MRALRALFARRVRMERFLVLTVQVPYGFEPTGHRAMAEAFDAADGAGWWFSNPDCFYAYFLARDGAPERVTGCERALKELSGSMAELGGLTFKRSEGTCIARFDWRGRLCDMPLGGLR